VNGKLNENFIGELKMVDRQRYFNLTKLTSAKRSLYKHEKYSDLWMLPSCTFGVFESA